MSLSPALLAPKFVPRIWGARSLAPLFPSQMNLAEPIGEAWLTGDDCVFATGEYKGRKLAEAWREMPAAWAGTRADTSRPFPLLVKFLFPEQWLSVQVHPTDDYAQRNEAAAGGAGKTEMWVALAAQPGAEVRAGLREDVTAECFRRAIAEGTADSLLERIAVAAGDAIYVPAGTMHTIGPGLTLCEIQENSDITYRVYDYNRVGADGKPRPLHIEKALQVTTFGAQSAGKIQPVRIAHGDFAETYYLACRYFATEKWEFRGKIGAVTQPARFELLIFTEGRGQIEWHGTHEEYVPGQVWFLPAALGAIQLSADQRTTVLRTYVPDIANDFVRRLAEQHVAEEDWSKLVHP